MKLKVFVLFVTLFGVCLFTNCGGNDSPNSAGNTITTQSQPAAPNDQAQPDSAPPSADAQPKQLPQTASNWANLLIGGATLIAAAAVLRHLK